MKRIRREIQSMKKSPSSIFEAYPINQKDLYKWQATLQGPEGTPYQKGLFLLDIVIPVDYPFKPPKVSFKTKIYHPNVDNTGAICLDIVKVNWSPSTTLTKILESIHQLMKFPNADKALVPEIGKLIKEDMNEFNKVATDWTVKFAM